MKCNLGQAPPGLAFRIVDGKIVWEPEPVEMTWDDSLKETGSRTLPRDRAALWLCESLMDGDRPAEELLGNCKSAAGVSPITLRRAGKDLKLRVYREGGGDGRWLWGLPGRQEKPAETPNPETRAVDHL